jgi:hypothetical protein
MDPPYGRPDQFDRHRHQRIEVVVERVAELKPNCSFGVVILPWAPTTVPARATNANRSASARQRLLII